MVMETVDTSVQPTLMLSLKLSLLSPPLPGAEELEDQTPPELHLPAVLRCPPSPSPCSPSSSTSPPALISSRSPPTLLPPLLWSVLPMSRMLSPPSPLLLRRLSPTSQRLLKPSRSSLPHLPEPQPLLRLLSSVVVLPQPELILANSNDE